MGIMKLLFISCLLLASTLAQTENEQKVTEEYKAAGSGMKKTLADMKTQIGTLVKLGETQKKDVAAFTSSVGEVSEAVAERLDVAAAKGQTLVKAANSKKAKAEAEAAEAKTKDDAALKKTKKVFGPSKAEEI